MQGVKARKPYRGGTCTRGRMNTEMSRPLEQVRRSGDNLRKISDHDRNHYTVAMRLPMGVTKRLERACSDLFGFPVKLELLTVIISWHCNTG